MSNQTEFLSRAEVLGIIFDWEIEFPQSSQHCRALAAFSVITFLTRKEMQQYLDITHPDKCVSRLRREGHRILTKLHTYTSRGGRARRMACYEYVGFSGDGK
jgi:hypothetical protein